MTLALVSGIQFCLLMNRGNFVPNAFGNAIGNSIVGAIKNTSAESKVTVPESVSNLGPEADQAYRQKIVAGGSARAAFDAATSAAGLTSGIATFAYTDEAANLGTPIALANNIPRDPGLDFGRLDREVAGYFSAAYDATQIRFLQQGQRAVTSGLEAFADYSIQNFPEPLQPVAGGLYAAGTALNSAFFPTGALDVVPELGAVVGALGSLRRADNALEFLEDASRAGRTVENLDINEFARGLATKRTPSTMPSDLFEIEQTGPINYTVVGENAKIDIDGFDGPTILEAKFVNNPGRSPFVAGSDAPDFIRELILEQQMDEFQRLGSVLADPKVPFSNLEVRVNDVRAAPYFQALINQFNIPGAVRVVETKIPQGK